MQKKKVLAIDDEQIVLDSIKKILSSDEYEVHTTLKGGTGISHAISEHFDVVLTDIRMPDIDGFKVIRDIRKYKPSIPIVIITGYASVSSAVQAMKLGATHYIEKPFTPDQLVQAIASSLASAAARAPEEQTIIHRDEFSKVLQRGANDRQFAQSVFANGADALEGFDLTAQEKLAIITADINWIEDQMGTLSPDQKAWLIEGAKK
ncbi:MAG: response regulator [Desulfobacterales bacterium]|jgi:DNA-binding NtrC family response regulator|nr:response regulator [Desulfobacterales bacterium]